MKKYIFTLFSFVILACISCDDVLDRPQLNNPMDSNYWRNETDLRLYGNGFYVNYFVGYNSGWGVAYAPLRGYNFADDFAKNAKQTNFENTVPSTRGSAKASDTNETVDWLTEYAGPTWTFAWVRKANIFIDRLENVAKPNITEEVYQHWMAAARFFRAFEYSRLVSVFGDVPYYDTVFDETDEANMFKARTPRNEVMDKVYDDFKYALEYLRENDGDQYLNRYIAAGFVSRLMLFEGTWQKYHYSDQERARKFLNFAKEAAEYIMDSGKWEISGDFRTLFGSQDLKGHKEVLMYRHYDSSLGVMHHVASYSNGQETPGFDANLALAKSFLCYDGKPYEASAVQNADKLDITHMILTRDPRFEATFWDAPKPQSQTLLYATKFIDRTGPSLADPSKVAMYASSTNTNDYPVLRYSEILLNWIEIRAELATMGGDAVTQADIDLSINAIRDRDLDEVAKDKGIQKTAAMVLNEIDAAFAPDREADVDPLIWEIRRERRMEFVFEHSRLLDLKRWKKLYYMDNGRYPDTMLGLWIDMPTELPSYLDAGNDGKYAARQVRKEDGTIVTYDGTNPEAMVGYYMPLNVQARDGFTDRSYLAPIGKAQIDQYAQKGYTLEQTEGWK